MGQLYTSGDWTVKSGQAEAFQAAWEETAVWTRANIEGSSWAVLTRDAADPNRFRSFGAWESLASIDAWRSNDGFRRRNDALMQLVDSFEARTLETVAEAT